jgi:prevent-host-death family protein
MKYNLSEAKAKFSAVMEAVEAGESVTLCKRNIPIAVVEPYPKTEGSTDKQHHTQIGWAKGTITIHDDLTEPGIPETDWDMLS